MANDGRQMEESDFELTVERIRVVIRRRKKYWWLAAGLLGIVMMVIRVHI